MAFFGLSCTSGSCYSATDSLAFDELFINGLQLTSRFDLTQLDQMR